ncbi:MAG TPA: EamA family transporter [Planktothrix sp.]|jgi:transporter family protein
MSWIASAFVSMLFAGVTAVIAKKGLDGISADLGLAIRTVFVFVFTLTFAAFVVPHKDLNDLKSSNWLWLSGSAVTTTLSWIFYYRAIKMGEVSTVALIDKGSVVVSVILALLVLHESMTAPKFLGSALIVGGLIVLARG